MKQVLLLRHAKSSWKDSELEDFDRPLNARGKQDAPSMGQFLASQAFYPDYFICSPAKRTRKTAQLIAKEIGFAKGDIQFNLEIYEAEASQLLHHLAEIPADKQRIIICGHNPGLEDLAKRLLPEQTSIRLPTCSMMLIELPCSAWDEIPDGQGQVLFYMFPKKLQNPSSELDAHTDQ